MRLTTIGLISTLALFRHGFCMIIGVCSENGHAKTLISPIIGELGDVASVVLPPHYWRTE